jgi:alpha-tubulin suppressor-like RCC1 family protein
MGCTIDSYGKFNAVFNNVNKLFASSFSKSIFVTEGPYLYACGYNYSGQLGIKETIEYRCSFISVQIGNIKIDDNL